MPFQINGATPSPATAVPPARGSGDMLLFPASGERFRGDGHSVTTGLPWAEFIWANIQKSDAAYWWAFIPDDTTPSIALTSIQIFNPRTGGFVVYSGSRIRLHCPTFGNVIRAGSGCIYQDLRVLVTGIA